MILIGLHQIYEPLPPICSVTVMEEMMEQIENGFHYVDEAAPPALMRLSLPKLRRKLSVTCGRTF
jgi:hypothetical protein